MKTRSIFFITLLLLAGLFLWLSAGVRAAPADQQVQYATPTPGPDGRIIYIVQSGDTCLRIQLITGVSQDYLITTNHLDQNCTIQVGQKLVIGLGGPAAETATPGPSPTPSPVPPTPTPEVGGSAEVCVMVFDDLNGDALRQATEPAIPGGVISLTSLSGTYSQTLTTTVPSDPTAYQGSCFTDVPAGKYTVSAAVPDGYNPTTALTFTLDALNPGETDEFDFGAQAKTTTSGQNAGGGRSLLLGVLGVFFLLGGIGLGVYTWRIMRKK
jgi:LysM repeat protein